MANEMTYIKVIMNLGFRVVDFLIFHIIGYVLLTLKLFTNMGVQ
jgi:hypothetical protein